MNNPTLVEGGPLWLMLLIAGAMWTVWAVMVYRHRVPRYRRQSDREITVNLFGRMKQPKRH